MKRIYPIIGALGWVIALVLFVRLNYMTGQVEWLKERAAQVEKLTTELADLRIERDLAVQTATGAVEAAEALVKVAKEIERKYP